MTKQEIGEKYNIPVEILDLYESSGLCCALKMAQEGQYDDKDLNRLSTILTLYDVGFTNSEIESYMKLMLEGSSTEKQRLEMLNVRRSSALSEIHLKEKQLDCLDCLIFKMQKKLSEDK